MVDTEQQAQKQLSGKLVAASLAIGCVFAIAAFALSVAKECPTAAERSALSLCWAIAAASLGPVIGTLIELKQRWKGIAVSATGSAALFALVLLRFPPDSFLNKDARCTGAEINGRGIDAGVAVSETDDVAPDPVPRAVEDASMGYEPACPPGKKPSSTGSVGCRGVSAQNVCEQVIQLGLRTGETFTYAGRRLTVEAYREQKRAYWGVMGSDCKAADCECR